MQHFDSGRSAGRTYYSSTGQRVSNPFTQSDGGYFRERDYEKPVPA